MGFILKRFNLMNSGVVFVIGFIMGLICSELPLETIGSMILFLIKGVGTYIIGPLGFTVFLSMVFVCIFLILFLAANTDNLPIEESFFYWLTDTVIKATKLAPAPIKTSWWNKLLGFHLAHMNVEEIQIYHFNLGLVRWVIIRPKDKDVRVHFVGILRTWFPVS